MSNRNMHVVGQRQQVMIDRCSPDSQPGGIGGHFVNVSCSFFRYKNDDLGNHKSQTI